MTKPFNVPDHLTNTAGIYRERNALYGDNYKRFGHVMLHMFPGGLTLRSAEDFNRFGVLVQIVGKVTRYAANFERGGHADSLDDNIVYAAMLRELDEASIARMPERAMSMSDLATTDDGREGCPLCAHVTEVGLPGEQLVCTNHQDGLCNNGTWPEGTPQEVIEAAEAMLAGCPYPAQAAE